jgi:hypothetical protein
VNLERKPFSVPEFLGGGIALASVALIALGMRVAPSQRSLPAPPEDYASVSIQSSEAPAKASIEQLRNAPDVAGASRGGQSLDAPSGTGVRQHEAEAAFKDATRVQSSLGPLPDPRPAKDQLPSEPNPQNVHAKSTFMGSWTDTIDRCRTDRQALLVINSRAAKTVSGECAFGVVSRETANRWRVGAICTAGGTFWRANIIMRLREPNLIWSSERGTETYVRCRR